MPDSERVSERVKVRVGEKERERERILQPEDIKGTWWWLRGA